MAQKKSKKSMREIDILAGNRLARQTGVKTSARDGLYSKKVTATEKQRSCKQGQVYSTKLKKCVVRKGQDPRFGKDRPKKAKKAVSDWKSWKSGMSKMKMNYKPGDFGEGPKRNK